jgi:hypothetical protein
MKNVALALAVLVMAPAAAHAGGSGGFVSLGVGATATTGGEMDRYGGEGAAVSLFVGQRFGMFGLEAGLSRYGIQADQTANKFDNLGLAAAGRFTLPIGPMFGAYLRAGIERTWMEGKNTSFSGTGWLAGIGAEYKLNLGFTSGGVFADYTRHDATFVNDLTERSGNVDVFSIGMSVGF